VEGTGVDRGRPMNGCCGIWLREEAVRNLKIQTLSLMGVNLMGFGVLKFLSQEVTGRVTTPEI
jgi:hypothetical protein